MKKKEDNARQYEKRKRARPTIQRKPAGIEKIIGLDDLIITKKQKRQRLEAMKETNPRLY